MKQEGSLRSHLVLGAVLWTAGLVGVLNVVLTSLNYRYPGITRFAHGAAVSVLAIGCMVAGLTQVRRALSPLDQMRARLASVRDGRALRVEGTYPTEVRPLVSDLNAFLDHREKVVQKAIAKAGDLAHGLKTPLAVLSQEAERAAIAGYTDIAATINQQVLRMRRQVDYHLAHARAAASGVIPGTRCSVTVSVEGLTRTLLRLYAGRSLAIRVEVSPNHHVRVQREDLDEMLGNLLDNGCKWAKSLVTVQSSEKQGRIAITIDDDGFGLSTLLRDSVMQRGMRADEGSPGSGLGLAIVRDLAELYGGTISLESSQSGGLRALLELPATDVLP